MSAAQLAEQLSPNELVWELLSAYEVADQRYDEWCELVGIVPNTEEADRTYDLIHTAYQLLWLAMGEAFFVGLELRADHWRASALTGNRKQRTRALA